MKVLVRNSEDCTEEVMEVETLDEAVNIVKSDVEYRAENSAENELDVDEWKEYFGSWEEAYGSAYELIRETLLNQYTFEILSEAK